MGDISWADSKLLEEMGRALVDEIKHHITAERGILMSQLSDAIAGYETAVNHQFDQIRAGLQSTIDNLQASLTQSQESEQDAETRAANAEAALNTATDSLQSMQNDMESGVVSLQQKAAQLAEDDEVAPEPEPEPQAKASARSTKK